MKKIIFTGIATLLTIGLYSNPEPPPEIHIHELAFTGTNSWSMEMCFYYGTLYSFDSITIQTSSGTARVLTFHGAPFIFFTSQDLSQALTINMAGDEIILTGHHYFYGNITCTLSFGNVMNPDVPAPLLGQSIARFEPTHCPWGPNEIFSLSNIQSIGYANDTTGAMSTLKGIVYDMNGLPVTNQKFNLDNPFTTNATGYYSTRIFSRIMSWDTICYEKWPNNFVQVGIASISYALKPDSSIIKDIHVTDSLLTGTPPQPKKPGSHLTVIPNPVTNLLTLSYSTALTASSEDLHIEICDMTGQKVLDKLLENQLGVARIPINLPNGMYIAILTGTRNIIGTVHFIINRTE